MKKWYSSPTSILRLAPRQRQHPRDPSLSGCLMHSSDVLAYAAYLSSKMYTRQCNCKSRFEYYISADSSLRLKNVGKLKLSSRLVTVPNDDKASCALNKHINSFAGCTPPHLLPLIFVFTSAGQCCVLCLQCRDPHRRDFSGRSLILVTHRIIVRAICIFSAPLIYGACRP
jgi:hypothetical protein